MAACVIQLVIKGAPTSGPIVGLMFDATVLSLINATHWEIQLARTELVPRLLLSNLPPYMPWSANLWEKPQQG